VTEAFLGQTAAARDTHLNSETIVYVSLWDVYVYHYLVEIEVGNDIVDLLTWKGIVPASSDTKAGRRQTSMKRCVAGLVFN
jgi:hypothetical protein